MSAILAIDAAWTERGSSGLALLASSVEGWRCVAVAPSYEAFLGLAEGIAVNWSAGDFRGTEPDATPLLKAASHLAKTGVDVVTIDMPVSTGRIVGRREADRQVSRAFGAQGCSTHTPNVSRPGRLGARLSRGFACAGYLIATATDPASTTPRLVEVYPHPALLALLHRRYRVPYKVGNSGRYWPRTTVAQRIRNLLEEFQGIKEGLTRALGPIDPGLPHIDEVRRLTSLKRYEDAIDALICGWVGVCYLQGAARAFGDQTAAIWCPMATEV